jgi:hypothetical protein
MATKKTYRYRVLYGENYPSWHKDFVSMRDTLQCVKDRILCGDRVFGVGEIAHVQPGVLMKPAVDKKAWA